VHLLADRRDYFPFSFSFSILPGHCFLQHWTDLLDFLSSRFFHRIELLAIFGAMMEVADHSSQSQVDEKPAGPTTMGNNKKQKYNHEEIVGVESGGSDLEAGQDIPVSAVLFALLVR
jgi:hypothetical protein